MEYGYGDDYCMNFREQLDDKVSSGKFAGPVNDWKSDSVTLYQYDFYQGKEMFTASDAEAFQAFAPRSGIVTGTSKFTLFE